MLLVIHVYAVGWVANVVKKPIQVDFLLPKGLITTVVCVNSVKKSLDISLFVANSKVSIKMGRRAKGQNAAGQRSLSSSFSSSKR